MHSLGEAQRMIAGGGVQPPAPPCRWSTHRSRRCPRAAPPAVCWTQWRQTLQRSGWTTGGGRTKGASWGIKVGSSVEGHGEGGGRLGRRWGAVRAWYARTTPSTWLECAPAVEGSEHPSCCLLPCCSQLAARPDPPPTHPYMCVGVHTLSLPNPNPPVASVGAHDGAERGHGNADGQVEHACGRTPRRAPRSVPRS